MIPKSNKTKNIIIEPTPAKIVTEPDTPVPIEVIEAVETKDEVVVPDVPEIVGLFSVKTDTYNAWVIRNSETSYKANLVLAQGSAYDWDASTSEEAESILQYHIVNMKL